VIESTASKSSHRVFQNIKLKYKKDKEQGV
jgi:hypothetical protein